MVERPTPVRPRPGNVAPLRSIGLELRKTDRAVEADLRARLSAAGIQIGMWLYLRALWHEDGLSQSELSVRVGASKPTTLDQLRRMELRGLVRFERSMLDRRLMQVFLTPEGKELEGRLLPFARRNHAAALEGFSAEQVEALYDALRRIRHNVDVNRHQANAGGAAPVLRPRKAR